MGPNEALWPVARQRAKPSSNTRMTGYRSPLGEVQATEAHADGNRCVTWSFHPEEAERLFPVASPLDERPE